MNDFDLPDGFDLISIRKQMSKELRWAQNKAKPNCCILCGQEKTSFCNSHSIPKSVLRNIADNGMVLQANALIGVEALDTEKGVNNSGTFYYICNSCDSSYFQDYENPENLRNKPTDRMMAEIALKDALIQLYKRSVEQKLLTSIQKRTKQYQNFKHIELVDSLDIDEYKAEIDFYKSTIDRNEIDGFQVLFWKILPYKVSVAAQTALALTEDREGRQVNNIFDMSKEVRMEYMHVCVFPLETKTIVLAFYHKRDRKYKRLLHQFNTASDEINLKYINWLVYKYTENFYISSSIRSIIESDKKLQTLSRECAGFPNLGMMSLSDLFKKYQPVTMNEIPNFLDIEYAVNTAQSDMVNNDAD